MTGGISLAQWHRLLDIPGVSVAAPVENVGYILSPVPIYLPLSEYETGTAPRLLRLELTWRAGLSTYPGGQIYVYFAPRARFVPNQYGLPLQESPGHPPLDVCGQFAPVQSQATVVFDGGTGTQLDCFSGATPDVSLPQEPAAQAGRPPVLLWVPLLVSAIDPLQEDKLLNLPKAIVSGRQLRESETASPTAPGVSPSVPMLLSTTDGLTETLHVSVDSLDVPQASIATSLASSSAKATRFVLDAPISVLGSYGVSAESAYQTDVGALAAGQGSIRAFAFWTSDQPAVVPTGPRSASVDTVTNSQSIWHDEFLLRNPTPPQYSAPPGNQGLQYRHLTLHQSYQVTGTSGRQPFANLRIVGLFDPKRLEHFSSLSQVPLPFFPPVMTASDGASRTALGSDAVGPTMDLGAYLSQPPAIITTIEGASLLASSNRYAGMSNPSPLEAVQVRVAGITGDDALSRQRIAAVAAAIRGVTHLTVVVTAGSSLTPVTLTGAIAGARARGVRLDENWLVLGVAVTILAAIDRLSLLLLALVLVVCALFIFNSTSAEVRSRRSELALMSCLGWSRRSIFRLTIGEVALVGGTAGVVGAFVTLVVSSALAVPESLARSLLVVPVAVILTVLSAAIPSWRSARAAPLALVTVGTDRREPRIRVRSTVMLAIANLLRRPGRHLATAAALSLGVASLTFILSVDIAFKGEVVGNYLGNVVDLHVQSGEVLSASLAILLAAASVADLAWITSQERSRELAMLSAVGWSAARRAFVVGVEGAVAGAAGAIVGLALGIGGAEVIGAPAAPVVTAAVLAGGAGLVVVPLALAVPFTLQLRVNASEALAEEG